MNGEKYKALRKILNLTQVALAERLNVSLSTIKGRERDDPRYQINEEARLAILYLHEHRPPEESEPTP
jgi:transcriptional regulator with XRE-family HTH domain